MSIFEARTDAYAVGNTSRSAGLTGAATTTVTLGSWPGFVEGTGWPYPLVPAIVSQVCCGPELQLNAAADNPP